MKSQHRDDETPQFDEILRTGQYRSLEAVRVGRDCYLVVHMLTEVHVYVDPTGKRPTFRHAWQIGDWLSQKFGIAVDSLPVRTAVRY